LDENIALSAFKQKYFYKKSFNDIRIYSNSGNFQLRLKDKNGFKIINAHLVIVNDQQKISDVKNISSISKRYNKSLASRQHSFDKKIKKGENDYSDYIDLTNPNDIDLLAFEGAKAAMNPTEKKMSFEEWRTYYSQFLRVRNHW